MAVGGGMSETVSIITLVLASAMAAGGAAWTMQLDNIAQKDKTIEALRESSAWDLPETIKNLKSAGAEIDASLKSRADQKSLENRAAELQHNNALLEGRLKVTMSELAETKSNFEVLKSQLQGAMRQPVTVELSKGQSEDVIPGLAALAVESVYPRTQVKGSFGGQRLDGHAGERLSYKVSGVVCTVYIKAVEITSAKLSVTCDN
ncbi:hypothetical protein [Pseudomonas fragi]